MLMSHALMQISHVFDLFTYANEISLHVRVREIPLSQITPLCKFIYNHFQEEVVRLAEVPQLMYVNGEVKWRSLISMKEDYVKWSTDVRRLGQVVAASSTA